MFVECLKRRNMEIRDKGWIQLDLPVEDEDIYERKRRNVLWREKPGRR